MSCRFLAPAGLLAALIVPAPAVLAEPAATASADEIAALRARLETVEARLKLIDRKFELLGAESEEALVGARVLMADPALLDGQAMAALEAKQPELAYRYFALLRSLHPESRLTRERFPFAVSLFRLSFQRDRYANPPTPWTTTEPEFMFDWLAAIFAARAETDEPFPQDETQRLFLGQPRDFFERFEAWGRDQPELRGWRILYEEDNGRLEKIEGQPTTDDRDD